MSHAWLLAVPAAVGLAFVALWPKGWTFPDDEDPAREPNEVDDFFRSPAGWRH